MTVNQRIKELLVYTKFDQKIISKTIGMSDKMVKSYINGNSKPNFIFLKWLFNEYEKLNAQWLFFGKGEMFLPTLNTVPINEKEIAKLKSEVDARKKEVEKLTEEKGRMLDQIKMNTADMIEIKEKLAIMSEIISTL